MSVQTTYTCDLCKQPTDRQKWNGGVLARIRTTNGFDRALNSGFDIELGDLCENCWDGKVLKILLGAISTLGELTFSKRTADVECNGG